MTRQKQKRFLDNETKTNVIQSEKPFYDSARGRWRKDFFKNDKPLVLELGCGKGEFTVAMARQHPEMNFVGVDVKGPRIWVGADAAEREGLKNAAFLRAQIQNLDIFFAENEVDEMWLPFPDPQPRERNERRRLTGPRFLLLYKSLLKPGGRVHLKTDNEGLFDYTTQVVKEQGYVIEALTRDFYKSEFAKTHYDVITYFENRYIGAGLPIYYMVINLEATQ